MYFLLKHLIQLTSCLCSFSKTKIWQLLPAPLFKWKEASVGRARFPLFVWIIHCPAKGPTSQIKGRKETYLSSNIKKTKPKQNYLMFQWTPVHDLFLWRSLLCLGFCSQDSLAECRGLALPGFLFFKSVKKIIYSSSLMPVTSYGPVYVAEALALSQIYQQLAAWLLREHLGVILSSMTTQARKQRLS